MKPRLFVLRPAHFYDSIARLYQVDDLRDKWFDPFQERSAAGVAYPQPDEDRRDPALSMAVGKVLVFRDDNRLLFQSVFPDRRVIRAPQADVGNMFGPVSKTREHPRQDRGQLGIDHKTRGLSDHQNGVIGLECRVFQTRGNIFRLEVGIVFEDLGLGDFRGQQIEDILDPDAHPANAGATATLVRIESDAFGHGKNLHQPRSRVKSGISRGGEGGRDGLSLPGSTRGKCQAARLSTGGRQAKLHSLAAESGTQGTALAYAPRSDGGAWQDPLLGPPGASADRVSRVFLSGLFRELELGGKGRGDWGRS